MEVTQFAIRIGCAIIAGLLIGFEREYKNKEAGLKTNALVSLGAAVFVIMSLKFYGEDYVDITRVLSQVVIGIGFIGGGTIVQHGKDIKGLTTAATIWCSAAVGCLAAFGMYWEFAILTAVVVVFNFVFGKIDKRIGKNEEHEE
ncbi:MAG: MgtC/SapB family protein [Marinirhabdus sp.]|nr:MgtC/SapB family protein [Marinirhabdus sp.]